MLSYVEFKTKIKEELLDNMSPALREFSVVLDSKLENGKQIDYFYVDDNSGRDLLPMALNPLYDLLYMNENKCNFDKTIKLIAREYEKKFRSMAAEEKNESSINPSDDDSVEFDINKIFFCVVNSETNEDMLSHIPHVNHGQIAAYLRLLISVDDNIKSLVIDNDVLDKLKPNGVTFETLFNAAIENTPKLFPTKVNELMPGLYLVSNEYQKFGSATLLYPESPVKGLAEVTKKDMIVLPVQTDFFICIENDSAVLDEDLYHQSNISIKKFVSDFGGSALSSTPFMFNAQSLSLETNMDRILFNEDIRTKDRSI